MERARFAHAIGEMGSSSGVGGEDGWNELLRERDQDWEVLESFFGGGSSTTAVHNNDDSAATNGEGIGGTITVTGQKVFVLNYCTRNTFPILFTII